MPADYSAEIFLFSMVSRVLCGGRDCLIAYYHFSRDFMFFFFNFLIFYGIKPHLKKGMGSLGISFDLLFSIFFSSLVGPV